jgi:hypothetical protein
MRINLWMLSLAITVAFAANSNAQPDGARPGRGGRGGIGRVVVGGVVGIAGNAAVQKELGLSADATDKMKAVSEEFNAAIREATTSWAAGLGDLRDMTQEERTAAMAKRAEMLKATADKFVPKLKELLTADQFKRLQQIHWQSMGIAAISDADMAEGIPLSKDQQDMIKSINTEYAAKQTALFTSSDGGRPEAPTFAKMQEQNRERDARIIEVLTKDQQDKFASLKGKEFDLTQLSPFGGGIPGGGVRNGGRPNQPQREAE